MFDQVVQWFRKAFGGETSSSVAKDRLRLVLLSDHLALAPEVIYALRRDLLEVISRYVEVDEAHSDVSFEHKEAGIAMLANIPILA
ncbi:MAG: cell division topological specificity factor MinE, partial [Vulcanimicrobiaceae bacterium]